MFCISYSFFFWFGFVVRCILSRYIFFACFCFFLLRYEHVDKENMHRRRTADFILEGEDNLDAGRIKLAFAAIDTAVLLLRAHCAALPVPPAADVIRLVTLAPALGKIPSSVANWSWAPLPKVEFPIIRVFLTEHGSICASVNSEKENNNG